MRGVVFDIDDTLYPECDYVRSGFAHVAGLLARTEDEAGVLSAWLWEAFEAGERGHTFDRLLEAFPSLAERASTSALVAAYRAHPPSIGMAADVVAVLDLLRQRGLRLAVLSDGPVVSQAAKATALGLDRWFDPVLLTGSFGAGFAKPGVSGFEEIARAWGLSGPELAYVADNPEKDFAGPRRLAWLTIRLRFPGQLRSALEPSNAAGRPDIEISAIDEVLGALRLPPLGGSL
jgi:putative hydrolase of the HAD superfamily